MLPLSKCVTVNAVLIELQVQLEVENIDKGDNFIGTLFFNKQNYAISLLNEGLGA